MDEKFAGAVRSAFSTSAPCLTLGAPVLGKECLAEPIVRLPIAMMNRHGLIAGATGTGKTRTLQLLAEQLSAAGVPVFLADVKGDLSGVVTGGEANDRIAARAAETGCRWSPRDCPAEFLSLSGTKGAQVRATVSSFGPLLLAKVLRLNETQSSALSLVFKWCDDRKLPLLDFPDLRTVLQYLSGEGVADLKDYGAIAKTTVNVLLRKMIELEQQGAEKFFGEPEFDLDDLLVTTPDGRGLISSLELDDFQDRPALFSTFMMWLLARLYHELPEVGDLEKPKLVFFFDEAHLLFDGASKAFLDSVEQVVRLIRSKGVGVFFITQNPKDIPPEILGQLGNRVQHGLRAFTPEDEKALRAAARTFPNTEFYDVEETLTILGIGEAFVSVLAPNGVPTSPVAVRIVPPSSRMGPLAEEEFAAKLGASAQVREYAQAIDRDSAREMLGQRLTREAGRPAPPGWSPAPSPRRAPPQRAGKQPPSTLEEILKSPVTRTVTREVARGILGALLGSPPRRRRY
jgi:uncharacterized protein